MKVVDNRINRLIKKRYEGGIISWDDILVSKIGRISTDEYLISRTMYRPRDVISFLNECIGKSSGFSSITASRIRDAESHYSDVRYRALGDEWIADYPNLLGSLKILKKRPARFRFSEITPKELDDLTVEILSSSVREICLIEDIFHRYFEGNLPYLETLIGLLKIFYKVGVLGIREQSRGVSWAFKEDHMIHDSQITGNEHVEICPMFYRVLGIG